jgi:hypothetical protein
MDVSVPRALYGNPQMQSSTFENAGADIRIDQRVSEANRQVGVQCDDYPGKKNPGSSESQGGQRTPATSGGDSRFSIGRV